MAVVIASSHCRPEMSPGERPRTPPLAPTQDVAVGAATGISEARLSTVAASEEIRTNVSNPLFFDVHLQACPNTLAESLRAETGTGALLQEISAVTTTEFPIYAPVTTLLTRASQIIFDSFTPLERRRLPHDKPILFLNHHRFAVDHFPVGRALETKPDIIGVYGTAEEFQPLQQKDGTYSSVPYHRVETVLEAKSKTGSYGKEETMVYLYHVQQSRPDRPGMYGISVRPQGFQIVYSCPLGLEASDEISWDDPSVLGRLCAYVYSLYNPPAGHILYDRTITWEEPSGAPFGRPMWTVVVEGETYAGCLIIFVGNPWGRRTTVFRVQRDGLPPIIIKEYYLSSGRRYEEGELLKQIHADGFVPGVVRCIVSEGVQSDGHPVAFLDAKTSITFSKRRIVLADSGLDLEQARSVNDILMTMYDVLEAHRTIANKRRVLHRDMSIYNVLMYPTSAHCSNAPWLKDSPPLIVEILEGKAQDVDKRKSHCMLIDLDNGAKLVAPDEEHDVASEKELQLRTGTPTYISRAVAVSMVPCDPHTLRFLKMPTLSEQAKLLYVALHGEGRYSKYNDNEGTHHGGIAPDPDALSELEELVEKMPFYHRWEYDAESVFWTLYSTLLRVYPQDTEVDDSHMQEALNDDWKLLKQHTIPRRTRAAYIDSRAGLIQRKLSGFVAAFLPAMQDVATMLHKMARQVLPSYALMKTLPPFEDHLHEAMQRLILDYLVAHRDNPIPLTPGVLRDVGDKHADEGARELGHFGPGLLKTASESTYKSTAQSHSKSKRGREEELEGEHSQPKPKPKKARAAPNRAKKETPLPDDLRPRPFDPPALKGEWEWRAPSEAPGSAPSTQ